MVAFQRHTPEEWLAARESARRVFARRLAGDRHAIDIEDLTHSTLIEVSDQPDIRNLAALCALRAESRSCDALRALRRRRPAVSLGYALHTVPARDDPEDAAIRQELLELLPEFLATLSEKERSILLTKSRDCGSDHSIDRAMGLRHGASKETLLRIRGLFRRYMDLPRAGAAATCLAMMIGVSLMALPLVVPPSIAADAAHAFERARNPFGIVSRCPLG